jgi:hypothetical protein
MADLGYPPWIPQGAIVLGAEGPTDSRGFGVNGHQGALDEVTKKLYEKYSEHAVVVNARIDCLNGSSHPSYGCRYVRVTGDLYLRQIEHAPLPRETDNYNTAKPNKKQNGLIQHGHAVSKG